MTLRNFPLLACLISLLAGAVGVAIFLHADAGAALREIEAAAEGGPERGKPAHALRASDTPDGGRVVTIERLSGSLCAGLVRKKRASDRVDLLSVNGSPFSEAAPHGGCVEGSDNVMVWGRKSPSAS